MPLLLLQKLIERVQQDARPLQPAVYAEIGKLIGGQCDRNPDALICQELRRKTAMLLMAEIRVPNSELCRYERFAEVFNAFIPDRLPNKKIERLTMEFLGACKSDFSSQQDEDVFVNTMAGNFDESADSELGFLLRNAINYIRSKLLTNEDMNWHAAEMVRRIIEATFEPCLEVPRTRELQTKELSVWHKSAERVSGECCPLTTRRDIGALTAFTSFWIWLHYEDKDKSNFVQLVEILEILANDAEGWELTDADCLNERANIFADVPTPPEPFYDGEI